MTKILAALVALTIVTAAAAPSYAWDLSTTKSTADR